MQLLQQALDYEAAQRVVANASEEVLALAEARRPAAEPVDLAPPESQPD
jgi:hypothetical protein